jgi:phosphatidylglycerophosphate synthase
MTTDGELWVHEQLATLRQRRFTPAAMAAFLLASQHRANEVRAQRPELARQSQRWICVGAGSWLALALAGSRRVRVQAPAGLLWWGVCAVMLDWHLGMVETLEGQPRLLGPGDALTLGRAWLVPVAWEHPTTLTCAAAGISDTLDGPLARHWAPTRVGRDFDWIIDACFAGATLRGATRHGLLARWAVRAETTWLSLGVARALHAYFVRNDEPDRSLTRHARAFASVRMTGLIAGTAGHLRIGSALLGGGAFASLALSANEFARRLVQSAAGTGFAWRSHATPGTLSGEAGLARPFHHSHDGRPTEELIDAQSI